MERLAVCSWSLQPQTPAQLVEMLKEIGVRRVQLALDPFRTNPDVWGTFPALAAANNISVVSGMLTTVNEDYTTMESIRLTGGIVPDSTWDENWENIQAIARIAESMQIGLVTFHAGFLPHDERDPEFAKLLHRLRLVADIFAARNIELGLETGQEIAASLDAFLRKLQRANVGVNFDPANMILYDKGNPIEALKGLAPWLKQCHIKDANRTRTPGTWGEEVPAGTGQVDWKAFFTTLRSIGFRGNLCIEREAGNQRVADIKTAVQLLQGLSKESL
ncbi:MAG TPA: sugar phosphate isomerase/epimerase family protein [Candidatus Saccharimonadales bacterium]|nr:sugar phosphate isomerase/epimerase family protein [Candidatus Saccharimonadales bacterium]